MENDDENSKSNHSPALKNGSKGTGKAESSSPSSASAPDPLLTGLHAPYVVRPTKPAAEPKFPTEVSSDDEQPDPEALLAEIEAHRDKVAQDRPGDVVHPNHRGFSFSTTVNTTVFGGGPKVLQDFSDNSPLGEDEIKKSDEGYWQISGKSKIDGERLTNAKCMVEDEIAALRSKMTGPGGNSLTALKDGLELLEQRLNDYPNNALRLHDSFLQVQRRISRDLASKELPDDHSVMDFSAALGTAAIDLHNACPNAKEVIQARIEARLSNADPEARANLRLIANASGRLTEPDLAKELLEDAELLDEQELDEVDLQPARYRLVVRLSKIIARDGANVVHALKELGAVAGGIASFAAILTVMLRFLF